MKSMNNKVCNYANTIGPRSKSLVFEHIYPFKFKYLVYSDQEIVVVIMRVGDYNCHLQIYSLCWHPVKP